MATPVSLARAPIDPSAKLECVSYAPFRGEQTPLNSTARIPAEQIAADLAQLATITGCVRTYSIDNGLDQVPALAEKAGLKVIQGIWLGGNRFKNLQQIATVVGLTKEFPGVITSVVVGNEVLLRGEMTAADLAALIRSVKAEVKVPVTYADVWEFWLRNREIYDAVDFVTIHILPYWEDMPVRASLAGAHVESIRKRVGVAFPGKDILIGETGWPSAGRMREGALPSRTNQARVVSDILTLTRREGFRVNLIEAYDQPWKRQLEGTVGGFWGLIDADARQLKYPGGAPISNFPLWKWYLGAGIALSAILFGLSLATLRRRPWTPRWPSWLAVFVTASAAGVLLGVSIDKMMVESLGAGGWLAWGSFLAAAVLAAMLGVPRLLSGQAMPTLTEVIGPGHLRTDSWLARGLGVAAIVLVVSASMTALGFLFDPRYRDFPFATLTIGTLPLLALALLNRPGDGVRQIPESVFAGLLIVCAIYTLFNEGVQNWQSVWTCAGYAVLAFTLWQARGARSPG